MVNIEKGYAIDLKNLSGEFYFSSILQEAYNCGFLNDSEMENIQLQCIRLLSDKCEKYNSGDSSSIRVEVADSIMKSNFYIVGLYLKSLPDPDYAVQEIKTINISELYEMGRKLINTKYREVKHRYDLVQKNKINTFNHSYNSTLSENGIGIFFKSYDAEYEAHESPASIDYQLCNPVNDLAGIEFIQKYLETVYLENEFCQNFEEKDIHHLLYGYDKGYKDLLLNIFEQVLTVALGCSLVNRSVRKLNILSGDISSLYKKLSEYDEHELMLTICKAAENVLMELNIRSLPLKKYVERSLPKITTMIFHALKTRTLNIVFPSLVNPDLKPIVHFSSAAKMDDRDYRKLIEELDTCRYSRDKFILIKENVKSFDDLEDLLLDAQFSKEEIISVLDTLGNIEIAEMIRRYPYKSDIQAVELSEKEQVLRLCLKNYVDQTTEDIQKQIFQIVSCLIEDSNNLF